MKHLDTQISMEDFTETSTNQHLDTILENLKLLETQDLELDSQGATLTQIEESLYSLALIYGVELDSIRFQQDNSLWESGLENFRKYFAFFESFEEDINQKYVRTYFPEIVTSFNLYVSGFNSRLLGNL